MLKHSVKLRRYLLCGCVAACHRMVCVLYAVQNATGYGLDGPGIESRWGRDFPHVSRPAVGPNHPPVQWILFLSRGKEWPGRDADLLPPSSAEVMKG